MPATQTYSPLQNMGPRGPGGATGGSTGTGGGGMYQPVTQYSSPTTGYGLGAVTPTATYASAGPGLPGSSGAGSTGSYLGPSGTGYGGGGMYQPVTQYSSPLQNVGPRMGYGGAYGSGGMPANAVQGLPAGFTPATVMGLRNGMPPAFGRSVGGTPPMSYGWLNSMPPGGQPLSDQRGPTLGSWPRPVTTNGPYGRW